MYKIFWGTSDCKNRQVNGTVDCTFMDKIKSVITLLGKHKRTVGNLEVSFQFEDILFQLPPPGMLSTSWCGDTIIECNEWVLRST